MKFMQLEDVLRWIDEVKEEFQREEDQGILQGRLDKASAALAGKDACERIRRRMNLCVQMNAEVTVMPAKGKRA